MRIARLATACSAAVLVLAALPSAAGAAWIWGPSVAGFPYPGETLT